MAQEVKNDPKGSIKKKGKLKKRIIIGGAAAVVLLTAAVIVVRNILAVRSVSARVTTYQVEEITKGDVSTTISGSGALTPVTNEILAAPAGGEVTEVNYTVGDETAEGDVIAKIDDDRGETHEITAPCEGILIELPISAGDSVAAGQEIAMVMGKDGFTLSVAVDETEISSLEMGQEAEVTVDALSEEYTGFVTEISYNGSSNGGTTAYETVVTMEYAEGIYPGMSASAQIVIEDSGEGLIVPAEAVGTSGDDHYVYLAPNGAEAGDQYEEDELDLADLEKVTVETGMSDGTYIRIDSDELEEGSLIIVTEVMSTQTGSEVQEENGAGGRGGFPGGGDFENFDFENFDPSNMPQGGGPGGGGFPGGGNGN